ncbi:hepatic lectin-like [Xenopus laevis]|uniref:Hepatic lectin-like n=1 Tax=Xenopus laevis TaxID=8355 RepID=A0A8J1MMV6_XENLA|nr:hepatic lectin-like [Xenopus laevis]
MDRGKQQNDFDEIYENFTGTMEPTESSRKKMKVPQVPKEENLSPKFLKASEMLRRQRRLLMVLGTLLVIAFTFLIILTSLMFIYYKEKNDLLTQIATINQTIDEQKYNLLTQITTINQTLDSCISETKKIIKHKTLQTLQKERPQCESNWRAFDGSCYYIVTTKKNWEDAQATCKAMNSDLVIITSEKEQNFIERITDDSKFWIGLTRDHNVWRWQDGTILVRSEGFWYTGEPNNEAGIENCVSTWIDKKWNDIFCTNQYKAICEEKILSCI